MVVIFKRFNIVKHSVEHATFSFKEDQTVSHEDSDALQVVVMSRTLC